ncbi:MAG TPA: hypothetical protein VI589_05705, partial [Vicinamibacteria bacterium]
MFSRLRTAALVPFVSTCLIAVLSGCGGGSPANPTPSPTPTPAPQPTPTPRPTPDPQAGLPPGPVVAYQIKLRSIESPLGELRTIGQDSSGAWIVYKGDFVVFDSDQFNAAGEKCKWVSDPEWFIDGAKAAQQTLHPNTIVFVKGSSNPFLLRTDMMEFGSFRLRARIDGVDSNEIVVDSQPKQ